eukprot:Hpha_TRINITY_DN5147_c0_g1::TRINITY_DN5147_c0_g1_i1::g.193098::m.193098
MRCVAIQILVLLTWAGRAEATVCGDCFHDCPGNGVLLYNKYCGSYCSSCRTHECCEDWCYSNTTLVRATDCPGGCCFGDHCGTDHSCRLAVGIFIVVALVSIFCCCCLPLGVCFFFGLACFKGRRIGLGPTGRGNDAAYPAPYHNFSSPQAYNTGYPGAGGAPPPLVPPPMGGPPMGGPPMGGPPMGGPPMGGPPMGGPLPMPGQMAMPVMGVPVGAPGGPPPPNAKHAD